MNRDHIIAIVTRTVERCGGAPITGMTMTLAALKLGAPGRKALAEGVEMHTGLEMDASDFSDATTLTDVVLLISARIHAAIPLAA